jgi:hypothetical protein
VDGGGEALDVADLEFAAVVAPVDDGRELLTRINATFIMATSFTINLLVYAIFFLELMAV